MTLAGVPAAPGRAVGWNLMGPLRQIAASVPSPPRPSGCWGATVLWRRSGTLRTCRTLHALSASKERTRRLPGAVADWRASAVIADQKPVSARPGAPSRRPRRTWTARAARRAVDPPGLGVYGLPIPPITVPESARSAAATLRLPWPATAWPASMCLERAPTARSAQHPDGRGGEGTLPAICRSGPIRFQPTARPGAAGTHPPASSRAPARTGSTRPREARSGGSATGRYPGQRGAGQRIDLEGQRQPGRWRPIRAEGHDVHQGRHQRRLPGRGARPGEGLPDEERRTSG